VSHYEIGLSLPTIEVLLELSDALGVGPEAMFTPVPEREAAMT
jgi:hypothetical protein